MQSFTRTFIDKNGVIHIAAMPKSQRPFTACTAYTLQPHDVLGLQPVNCIPCLWREFHEYIAERLRERIENALDIPREYLGLK